jgi:hypothetical protein
MSSERQEPRPDENHQAVKERYTPVWIAVCLVLLQSGLAVVHSLTWLWHGRAQWHAIFSEYSPSRTALWFAAEIWSVVSLMSVVLLSTGRRAGRGLYASGAILWLLTCFVLAPWPLALSGAVLPLLVLSILYGRSTRRYLDDGAALTRNRITTARGGIAGVLWVITFAYYHAVFLMQLTNKGWLADITHGPQRRWAILATPLLPVITVLWTGRGQRQWRLGIFLFVSGLSALFVLLGYIPYSRALVGLLGPGYVGYAVPWAGATRWVVCLLFFGGVLISAFRPWQRDTRSDHWAID